MKHHISECLNSLKELESKMLGLQRMPPSDLRGHDLVDIDEALRFMRLAEAALRQSERELADVPETNRPDSVDTGEGHSSVY